MYWSPNFLAVIFKKQEIPQQVTTRMQDLASEFSKIFRGWYSRNVTAGGNAPVLGPKPIGPLNFSAVIAPLDNKIHRQAVRH